MGKQKKVAVFPALEIRIPELSTREAALHFTVHRRQNRSQASENCRALAQNESSNNIITY